MAIVVLFSTMSFTIHNRYCDDQLIDTTLYLNSDSCESDETNSCCLISDDCCSQEKIIIYGQDELQTTAVVFLALKKQYFIEDLPELNFYNFKIRYQGVLNEEYSPPILIVDRQSNHQVFLI